MMPAVMGQGSVILPEFNITKVPLPEGASLEVKIQGVRFHEQDDCLFFDCIYPTGILKKHQLFKPLKIMDLQHKMVNVFSSLYGIKVTPTNAFPAYDPTGFIATFKEI